MPKKETVLLERFYDTDNKYEICIDEAGRGCLFGRVYVACVVLPKDPSLFDGTNIKDSKKFSSKKKLKETAEYIKQNALYWKVEYLEADVIDDINILKSVMRGMHSCIRNTIHSICEDSPTNVTDITAIVDGNYFTPYMHYNEASQCLVELNYTTVEQGDAKYMGIAAASILAKNARDAYVETLCDEYTVLDEYYGLRKNVGYGTKQHREGIQQYGITQWHRKTFGELCRNAETFDVVAQVDS
jgi:ribonuclease HII|uniref:Ribonuclease HII n=1 Tax=viral metagenome TaxID=1070528 RepID=A0A6C0IND5_9ZZZZ